MHAVKVTVSWYCTLYCTLLGPGDILSCYVLDCEIVPDLFLTVLLLFIFSAGKDSLLCGIGGQMNRAVITVILKIAFQKMQKVMKAKDKSALEQRRKKILISFQHMLKVKKTKKKRTLEQRRKKIRGKRKTKKVTVMEVRKKKLHVRKLENERRSHAHFHIVTRRLFTCRSTSEMFMTGRKNMREQHYRASSCEKSTSLPVKKLLLLEIAEQNQNQKKVLAARTPIERENYVLCLAAWCLQSDYHSIYREDTN
ncbi:hypothetical protein OS493_006743 [Desmophyllum pertusum]|uniref:Uncharacterized protein n=1 Tax=Desmophyllum pertusum TaxID=174260 RepID=A0A9W9ZRY5_9CNID|nr:hypothetical protein OS493_006743 [Desmophyllum pertusum]